MTATFRLQAASLHQANVDWMSSCLYSTRWIVIGRASVEADLDRFFDSASVPVWISVNALDIVPAGAMSGRIGVFRYRRGLTARKAYVSLVLLYPLLPEAWMPTIRKHSWEHSDVGTANHRATRSPNHNPAGAI